MLGRVTWGGPEQERVATLNDDRTWTVTGAPGAESWESTLATLYSDEYAWWQAEHGAPGAMVLEDLAKRMNGTVEFVERSYPPGTVF